jgi:hypothetical protein
MNIDVYGLNPPLITQEGGIDNSKHAARLTANLARALMPLSDEFSSFRQRAHDLVSHDRRSLLRSQRPGQDEQLVRAVELEVNR